MKHGHETCGKLSKWQEIDLEGIRRKEREGKVKKQREERREKWEEIDQEKEKKGKGED